MSVDNTCKQVFYTGLRFTDIFPLKRIKHTAACVSASIRHGGEETVFAAVFQAVCEWNLILSERKYCYGKEKIFR